MIVIIRKVSLNIIFILISLFAKSQVNLDSLLNEEEKIQKELFNSFTFSLSESNQIITSINSKTYENKGLNHSTFLILNADSTFIYYSIYKLGFDLSVGQWTKINTDTLTLNWDCQKTADFIKDANKRKIFYFDITGIVPMTNWLIEILKSKLVPLKSSL